MLTFLKVQSLIVFRTLKQLGVTSIYLLLILFVWGYVVSHVSLGWTIGTYVFVILAYHVNRGDMGLLYALYGKKYKIYQLIK